MLEKDFLDRLRQGLEGFTEAEIEERVTFYREMIEDRMEEGLAEEEAVEAAGPVDEIIAQIMKESSIPRTVKQQERPARSRRPGEILLLILGAPLWLVLLIAAFAVVLAVYLVLWAVIVCLWAVEVSLIGCALGGMAGGIVSIALQGNVWKGVFLIGAGLVCAGLSIFLFFGCKAATKGAAVLTKKIALGIRSLFIKRRRTE